MPGKQKLTARQRESIRAKVAARVRAVEGTLLPDDAVIVDLPEFVSEAAEHGLGQTAAYKAAHDLEQQSFVLEEQSEATGQTVKTTMVSSGGNYFDNMRLPEARQRSIEASNLPPRPGKRERGRPRKA